MSNYPKPSVDPRDYDCAYCHAKPGDQCISPARRKIDHAHVWRVDSLIAAHDRWAKSESSP